GFCTVPLIGTRPSRAVMDTEPTRVEFFGTVYTGVAAGRPRHVAPRMPCEARRPGMLAATWAPAVATAARPALNAVVNAESVGPLAPFCLVWLTARAANGATQVSPP